MAEDWTDGFEWPGVPQEVRAALSRGAPSENETAVERRAKILDTLAAVLPTGRCDRLAELLTDDDVATLRHLTKQAMGKNSLRALTSDLAYLEGWCRHAVGGPLPWPASDSLVLKFIAHHLWDHAQREADVAHGMPEHVIEMLQGERLLRRAEPHAPQTVRRRLASWATLHRWRGIAGPFASPSVRTALKLAVRAADRPRGRKSKKAVTADILERLLRVSGSKRLTDVRDRALLLVAFASGGRRRSEIATLRVEQIEREEAIVDYSDQTRPALPCRSIRLGRTKTANADVDARVLITGRAVIALDDWLLRAGIAKGAVFRAIDRWGSVGDVALSPQAVNLILKRRCKAAGFDPGEFSAHGLRSGYLTEAARQGVALPEAMQQSGHRSIQQAASYYNDAERRQGRAVRLV